MGTLRKYWAKKNMPGSKGYNSKRGSGVSYYFKRSGKAARGKGGRISLI